MGNVQTAASAYDVQRRQTPSGDGPLALSRLHSTPKPILGRREAVLLGALALVFHGAVIYWLSQNPTPALPVVPPEIPPMTIEFSQPVAARCGNTATTARAGRAPSPSCLNRWSSLSPGPLSSHRPTCAIRPRNTRRWRCVAAGKALCCYAFRCWPAASPARFRYRKAAGAINWMRPRWPR